jgi:uncharacterized protein (UPF0276 family)
MSLGGTDPYDADYFAALKRFVERFATPFHSDHLCFCGVDGRILHDLLPMPQTRGALAHTAARVREARERIERPMAIENISFYLQLGAHEMDETTFINGILDAADCGLLLDVNNVYVSSVNHDFDPFEYLRSVPHERVVQFHLAGHTNLGTHCIDTHDGRVIQQVWQLYRLAHELTGGASTLLEWDAKIPEFPVVHAEVLKARKYMDAELQTVPDETAAAPLGTAAAAMTVPHPASFVAAEAE